MANDLSTAVRGVCTTITTPEFRANIARTLPPGVTADRFERVALTAIQQNPGVVSGDRNTLYLALQRCAADGLLPDGREAALVTFGGKVQYMPMVGGIIKKLGESGIAIRAEVVRANDTFGQQLGDAASITHTVPPLGTSRGDLIGVYAIASDRRTGEILGREVMDRDQVDQVRKASRSANAGPWVQWFDEMARKTVIRRLAKRLPLTEQAQAVVQADDDMYSFGGGAETAQEGAGEPRDVTPVSGPRRPRALAAVAPAGPQDDATVPVGGSEPPAEDEPVLRTGAGDAPDF